MRIFSCHVGRLRLPVEDERGESRCWERTALVIWKARSGKLLRFEKAGLSDLEGADEEDLALTLDLEATALRFVGLVVNSLVRISRDGSGARSEVVDEISW